MSDEDRLSPEGDDPPTLHPEGRCLTAWGRDSDHDGYGGAPIVLACGAPGSDWTEEIGDCDDADPLVHPGRREVCDPHDLDEDCDGWADTADVQGTLELVRWYEDSDGDGYGYGSSVLRCDQPAGYTDRSGDCEPLNPDSHPGAYDACPYDDVDEDCNGDRPWYLDEDGDGHGTHAVEDCIAPRSEASGDCDDADPGLHPSAREICDDGVDQDCDGNAGRCGVEGDWNLMTEPSQLPGGALAAGDVDGDGALDLLVTGRHDDVHVFAGPFDASVRAETDASWTATPPSDAIAASLGDLDGDGRDDVIVSEYDSGHYRTWVDFAPAGVGDGSAAELVIDRGWAAGPALDSDGDGVDEIAISVTTESGPWKLSLLGGATAGTWDAQDLVLAELDGSSPVAIGDTNGDGLDDLAWIRSSEVAVAYGPIRGAYTADEADVVLLGFSGVRHRPAAAGDLDGDGTADLLVTAYGDVSTTQSHSEPPPPANTVYLLGAPLPSDLLDAEATFTSRGLDGIGGAGDLDGDGRAEVLLEMRPLRDGGNEAFVVSGPYSGVMDPEAAIAAMGWFGNTPVRAATVADLDGDGDDDLAVSTGQTWLFFGGPGL